MIAHRIVLAFAFSLAAAILTAQTARQPEASLALGTTKGVRHQRLVIQNAMIISGRGEPNTNRAMPPEGPVDIVIEGDAITNIIPLDPVNSRNRGARGRATGDRVLDATGMYVIPGLIEMHAHLPGKASDLGPRGLDYAYRLYLGHGVTTVRDAGTGAGLELMTGSAVRAMRTRLLRPDSCSASAGRCRLDRGTRNTPEKARAMVQRFRDLGADCVKVSKSPGHYPDVLEAIVNSGVSGRDTEEPIRRAMKVMIDLKVSETSALVASNIGVASIEHFYGVPESALEGSQNFPADYNYWDELDRFRWAGRIWAEADREHPERILKLIDTFIKNGTNWNPTMAAYEKNRDLSRALTLPFFQTLVPAGVSWTPDASVHGRYHHEWKTSDEVAWRQFFAIWMKYINEFYRRGGLLTAGSDQGDIGGIGLIRELELLQEAGLNPIDIFKVATTNAARVLASIDTVECGSGASPISRSSTVIRSTISKCCGRGYGFYGIVPATSKRRWAA
jgi:hypothetical protein